MNRDYRYAIYAFALAAIVTLSSGLLVVAGEANADEPEVQFTESNVELLEDDVLTDEEVEQLPDLLWATDEVRDHFVGDDALADPTDLEFTVAERTTYDEDEEAFVPVDDVVEVTISPADDRLPYVSATVDLDAETVDVERHLPSLDEVDLVVDDAASDEQLSDEERAALERALLADADAEWKLASHLDAPDEVTVTVLERDGDRVTVDLGAPDAEGTIEATVDLDAEHVDDLQASGELVFEVGDADDYEITAVEPGDEVSIAVDGNGSTAVASPGPAEGIEFEVSVPNETEVELEDVTATLVDHDDILADRDATAFAERVWTDAVASQFEDAEAVEMALHQERELDADREEFVPTDGVRVEVTPVDGRLPSVDASVDLEDGTVEVVRSVPDLGDVDLELTDPDDLLTDTEADRLADLVVEDGKTRYNLQTQFDDLDAIRGTVTETTTADGDAVLVELTPADGDPSATVVATVDLETETVVSSYTMLELEFESSDVEVVDADSAETGETITLTSDE
ncbi:hypothetical protein [Halopiger goleimassiliensis]|uniref:hypothetical protein n=1 Tax=Halopiger goleimassiliensis TaxID=1293048 RepID=UPI000677BB3C|nr:hypothetical protein [Halopiger goleimassiliensis]